MIWYLYGRGHDHSLCCGSATDDNAVGSGQWRDRRPIAVATDIAGGKHVWLDCPDDPCAMAVIDMAERQRLRFPMPELSARGEELIMQAMLSLEAHRTAMQMKQSMV